MDGKTFILVSVPGDFVDKFTGFVNNLNMLNNDSTVPPVKIEKIYFKKKVKYVAIPKEGVSKVENKD